MKVPMTALKSQVYGGRRIKPGDDFEASGQTDARVLKALGRAKDRAPAAPPTPAVGSPPRAAQSYSTRMLSAAAPSAPSAPRLTAPPLDTSSASSTDTATSPAAKKAAAKRASNVSGSSRRTDDTED